MGAGDLALSSSIVLGVIVVSSALPKLRRPNTFAVTVIAYDILPVPLAQVYARLVPVAELSLALILLTGALVRLAALACALLLTTFTVGVLVNLVRGRKIDCGCFGSRSRKIGKGVVALQAVLIAIAAVDAANSAQWFSTADWSPWRALGPPEVQPVVGLAICLTAAVACALLLGRRRGAMGLRVPERGGDWSSVR